MVVGKDVHLDELLGILDKVFSARDKVVSANSLKSWMDSN
jgi:hypothetical protein